MDKLGRLLARPTLSLKFPASPASFPDRVKFFSRFDDMNSLFAGVGK
jgi:hypothetical protein